MNAAANEKLDEVPLHGIDLCRTEVNRSTFPLRFVLLGKMRVGRKSRNTRCKADRTCSPNSVLQSRVAKPVRRYLAHTRANKAALLCGPAFCARIPRVRSALPPSPPPWFNGTARTMQFCLYSTTAVTMQLLLPLSHIAMILQRDGRPSTFERFWERLHD